MCGRFTLRTGAKAVADAFDIPWEGVARDASRPARFNIAPTQWIEAVRWNGDDHRRELASLCWGLVPRWADDPSIGNRMINARAESAADKPAFREAFRQRRCLIPCDGFYEWRRKNGSKQPHYIRLKTDRLFALAGLWERWQRGGVSLESCTILTTDANELVEPLHNRMPVIIDPADFNRWLDPALQDPKEVAPLLHPYAADRMLAYPVSTKVNSPAADTPECIEAAAPGKVQGSLF